MRTLHRLAYAAATLGGVTLALPAVPGALLTPASAQDAACAIPAHIDASDVSAPDPQLTALHEFARGSGVRVAVIDTGVAPTPELDQLIAGRDLVSPDAPAPFADCDSHGTVVAGIVAGTTRGVAPDAEVIAIRQTSAYVRAPAADGEAGSGSLLTLADAIHNALDEHAAVINISVVSCLPPDVASRVDTWPLDAALARAEAEGAVVVAAAGNATAQCQHGFTVFPAHAPTVIAVAARADDYTLADYSIDVPGMFVSAPGFVDAAPGSDGGGWATGTYAANGTVQPYVGTSFAAPVVSGAVALLRERHPGLSAAEVRALVYAAAQPFGGALDPTALLTLLPPPGSTGSESGLESETAAPAPLRIEPAQQVRYASRRRWVRLAALLAGAVVIGAAARSGATTRRGEHNQVSTSR